MIRVPTKLKPRGDVPIGELDLHSEEELAFSVYERIRVLHKRGRSQNGCLTFCVAGYVPEFKDDGIITFRSTGGANGREPDFGDANCIQFKVIEPGLRIYRFTFCKGQAFDRLILNRSRPFYHFELDEVRPELKGIPYKSLPKVSTKQGESEPPFLNMEHVQRQVLKELGDI